MAACSHQKHLNVIKQALANLRDGSTNVYCRCTRSSIDRQLIDLMRKNLSAGRRVNNACRCEIRLETSETEAEEGSSNSPLASFLGGSTEDASFLGGSTEEEAEAEAELEAEGLDEEAVRLQKLKVRMITRCVWLVLTAGSGSVNSSGIICFF